MANKIEVRFQPEKKLSKAGHEYTLLEMWITNRDGTWPERPTVSMMPFHARLLLQSLPEFCTGITAAESLKDSDTGVLPEDQVADEEVVPEKTPF